MGGDFRPCRPGRRNIISYLARIVLFLYTRFCYDDPVEKIHLPGKEVNEWMLQPVR